MLGNCFLIEHFPRKMGEDDQYPKKNNLVGIKKEKKTVLNCVKNKKGGGVKALCKKSKQKLIFSLSHGTAVQLVYNSFSQIVSQLEIFSKLQLSLQSDPIALHIDSPLRS